VTLSLNLVGMLGTSLTVHLENEQQVLPTLRQYGLQGWTSGSIPAGGLVLPLAMADTFDWALIGARAYTSPDGEQAVMYRGQSYKRRELDEVDTKKVKLPRIVKFSRGARPTDPAHLKEGDESGVQYVSLISFRGNGRVIEAYLDPAQRTDQDQQQAQSAARPAQAPAVQPPVLPDVLRKTLMARIQTECRRLQISTSAALHAQGRQRFVEIDDLDLSRMAISLEAQVAL
jgi:hypothetical protein